MPSIRARFTLSVVASPTDSKTNMWSLNTIQFLDDDDDVIYAIPEQYRATSHHDKLCVLPAALIALKNMPRRHTRRSFKVSLADEVKRIYCDADGNPVFRGDPLDIYDGSLDTFSSPYQASSSSSARMLSDVVKEAITAAASAASANAPTVRSIASIVKDAVINKFEPKKANAASWIGILERECVRLSVEEDRYWEVLRLFIGGAAENWFASIVNKSPTTEWAFWRESFLKNFSKSGWNVAASAFQYRYINGSLIDYVHAKINLLSLYNPKMHDLDVMSHIVLGLPTTIQDKINPNDVATVDDLVSTIIQFEKPVTRTIGDTKTSSTTKATSSSFNAFASLRPRVLCAYCKSKGFERFHREMDCFTKFKDTRDKSYTPRSHGSKDPAINTFNLATLQEEINEESKN